MNRWQYQGVNEDTAMRSHDDLPFSEKISPAACLGRRTLRPLCLCCGGADGIRAAYRDKVRRGKTKPRKNDFRDDYWK